MYLGPLEKLIQAAPEVNVLSPRPAERHILALAKRGDLSLAVAERQIGMLRVIELCQDADLWDTETTSRRHRELRSGWPYGGHRCG
jgi:hypothetical protein